MLVDSHCHLDSRVFDRDRDAVIQRAREAGVSMMMTIGTGNGPPDLEAALRIARDHADIAATAGVHPHDAGKFDPGVADRLDALCRDEGISAVGEIGLDYHYDHSPRALQKQAFIRQMEIAGARRKPIVIHTRDAWDDTLELLAEHWSGRGLPGVMHCFTGTSEQALRCLNMGFLISFSGVLTFARSSDLRATARWTPLDRTLVETDSPYLTPAPYRRIRRNEPRFVVETARVLAEVKGLTLEEVARETTANYRSLLGIGEAAGGSRIPSGNSAT